LSGINLSGADLTGSDLSGTNLFKADLFKADLTEANLSKADLTKADLSEVNLTETDLYEANLFKTIKRAPKLQNKKMEVINMTKKKDVIKIDGEEYIRKDSKKEGLKKRIRQLKKKRF